MSRGTALITGPTAGIGLAFAEQLAARGQDLVLVARDRARLEDLAARLSNSHDVDVEVLVADLADREQIAAVEARVADPERPVSLLVNNAGFGHKHPFTENSVEEEQEMLDVLVTAVMRLSHAAIRPMLQRGEGSIVNVSSVAAFLPRGTYSAAKAYVVSFSEWLDLTYRHRGVRGMALCPGFVRTEFHARMGVGRDSAPGWMWLDAERLVREALVDLERGKAISIPSKRYKLLSALARATPSSLQGRFQALGRK
ncbi:MAG: SDR family NAD(P)-dependent oxidoreductase [Nocardioidaceae bacterium]